MGQLLQDQLIEALFKALSISFKPFANILPSATHFCIDVIYEDLFSLHLAHLVVHHGQPGLNLINVDLVLRLDLVYLVVHHSPQRSYLVILLSVIRLKITGHSILQKLRLLIICRNKLKHFL